MRTFVKFVCAKDIVNHWAYLVFVFKEKLQQDVAINLPSLRKVYLILMQFKTLS